ncbi:helix-turn-helix transcriptional regulator [Carboxydothermus pertinax]|uniref:Uncharacterized protein n=1 Tax=Carboxydothermus pertinax TaxID=870242 RepID=A0A1L8CUR2_9THEO|nr:helix-turn-helix domain-containing protein [Carboxydothermus pertinax]GAV22594.1 hypothetical protein cpu_11040 [Carboxydothermus pertinax]
MDFHNRDNAIEEKMGSATHWYLNTRSPYFEEAWEIAADGFTAKGAPFSFDLGFKDKCDEIGVPWEAFIDQLKAGKSDTEIAEELGITEKLAENLRYQFEKYGITGVTGQD